MKWVVLFLVMMIGAIALLYFKVERGVPPRLETEVPLIVSDTPDKTESALDDVLRTHAMLVNFLTATKEPYRPPLGDNEDVVRALTGGNRYGDVYLPTNYPEINERGQLVDLWGTPYHFHARAVDVIDVRSAGPDRILFTLDDIRHP